MQPVDEQECLQIHTFKIYLDDMIKCRTLEQLSDVGQRIAESPSNTRTLDAMREAYRVRMAQLKEPRSE